MSDALRIHPVSAGGANGIPRTGYRLEAMGSPGRSPLYPTFAAMLTAARKTGGRIMCPRCCGSAATQVRIPDPYGRDVDPDLVCPHCIGRRSRPGDLVCELRYMEGVTL